ncbi:DUF4166 domain-containing protein [Agromyces atrinae]|uniref:DUF4166 domain-containing protein n=1 Tax=Agromyces atrinae TaxID=592376 RepID=UPI001F5AF495|nr:DUF4166 domain-containing protein [Agromyces atrinae]MCI2958534.1 DUF4166 domain-containing protein [Agromyces atrinae]
MSRSSAPGTVSPYEAVLGARIDDLHPRLRRYFSTIADGHVGVGRGVFDVVGSPRRSVWPLLAVLARFGVAFPGYERGVAFDVVNTPVTGRAAVAAERTFHLRSGTAVMRDRIAHVSGALVDDLGRGGILRVRFVAAVDGAALVLRSDRVGFRLGRMRVRLPRLVAPRVTLTERFDDDRGEQVVACTVELPVLGVIYSYRGSFDYRIESRG